MIFAFWMTNNANRVHPRCLFGAENVFVDLVLHSLHNSLGFGSCMNRVIPGAENVLILSVIHLAFNAAHALSRFKIVRGVRRGCPRNGFGIDG
jgi:hypothetical protein